jgi:hypothetical protein
MAAAWQDEKKKQVLRLATLAQDDNLSLIAQDDSGEDGVPGPLECGYVRMLGRWERAGADGLACASKRRQK